jgi:hypothetical protein
MVSMKAVGQRRWRRTLLAITFCLFRAASTQAAVPSYDEYQSWLVACDNALACEAKTVGGEAGHDADLRLLRAPDQNASPSLEIRTDFPIVAADLSLDGSKLASTSIHWEVMRQDGSTSLWPATPEATRAVIDALRRGATLTVGSAVIDLAGLKAAMLRMDDRQGRVSTRAGRPRLPEPAVPRAPPYFVTAAITDREAKALLAAVRVRQARRILQEGCEKLADEGDAYALNGGQAVAILPCQNGAYQQTALVFIVARDGAGGARLFTPRLAYLGEPSHQTLTQITGASFEPETGSLGMLQNLRADGECGLSAEWRWDGSDFQLTSFAFQSLCGGSEPGDWPTLFETR